MAPTAKLQVELFHGYKNSVYVNVFQRGIGYFIQRHNDVIMTSYYVCCDLKFRLLLILTLF